MNEVMNSMIDNKSEEEIINSKKEQFKDEIKEYKDLIDMLNAVEGIIIDTSQKISIAFIIEEMKNKNPEGWRDELKEFKDKIENKAKEGGEAEVSWFLSEYISAVYLDFLKMREESVKDEALKKRIGMIRENSEENLNFRRKHHKEGEPVAFGGVSMDYTPEWHRYKDL